jgi:eukaryotic-like serine/threonine-protein kinase
MSVVYKGMDTSLNREVAVKVLHHHLASSAEARERFEREAHAVAKLRHENILEIYDYSGRKSADSYIVTELIKGRTLRTFIADQPLAYPEVAAMIVVEVCRALAHAHSLGVLHRDVKPENIMIREDGVLKLMDFGIAQIVDSQRLTVTGQLLGSPAYMSPEHVEGRPLDFRTDVFSVGILLYQLATSELPFKGRNPHEILKRIAECKYLDARVVNPLVADRLSTIIGKALARLPDDRYPDVSQMLDDLQAFLADIDITDARTELVRFFTGRTEYERSLRERLITVLSRRGSEELTGKHHARALEMWNRVLTIDPSNNEVLRLIDRLSKRRRITATMIIGVALLGISGGVAMVWKNLTPPPPADEAPVAERPRPAAPPPAPAPAPSPSVATAVPDAGAPHEVARATQPVAPAPEPASTAPSPPPRREAPPPRRETAGVRPVTPPVPAGPAERTFVLVPTPQNAYLRVDNEPGEHQVTMGDYTVKLGPGPHRIHWRHERCQEQTTEIAADDPGQRLSVSLPFKATRLHVTCPKARAIYIGNDPVTTREIISFDRSGNRVVEVTFVIDDSPVTKPVMVHAGDPTAEVTCD